MNESNEAILRHKCREMYRQFGYDEMLLTLSEMLKIAEILGEVIVDEKRKESRGK